MPKARKMWYPSLLWPTINSLYLKTSMLPTLHIKYLQYFTHMNIHAHQTSISMQIMNHSTQNKNDNTRDSTISTQTHCLDN